MVEDITDMFSFHHNLINEIQNYPCTYDKTHVGHFKCNKKQEVYDIIGTALGVRGKFISKFHNNMW